MSLLADGLDLFLAALEDANIIATVDTRNVAPPCVIVDPPSIVAFSGDTVTLEFPVAVCCPPPANPDTLRQMLDSADAILELFPVTSGNPGTYTAGAQHLPAYLLIVQQSYTRS